MGNTHTHTLSSCTDPTSLIASHLCMSQPKEPINIQHQYAILIHIVSCDGCCQMPGLYRISIAYGLLTDQNQYFNGSLNHVYWLQFAEDLPASCLRVCTGLNVELVFTTSHSVSLVKPLYYREEIYIIWCLRTLQRRSFFHRLRLEGEIHPGNNQILI